MPNKNLTTFETLVTPSFTFGSVANGAGRITAVIVNTTTRARSVLVAVRITTGATAPTAGAPYKVGLVRRLAGSPDVSDDGLGTADAAVATEPVQVEWLGAIYARASTATQLNGTFVANDPGPQYSVVVFNNSGQTVSTTNGDHLVQVVPITDEVQ